MAWLILLIGVFAILWLLIDGIVFAYKRPKPSASVEPRSRPVRRPPHVAAELRPLLNRPDVLVIDVETTGLGDRAEVLSVAAVDTTGRVLLDAVCLPQGCIPAEASDLHGLTRARLRARGARSWPEVHPEVATLLLRACAVLAWNAEFDRRLLEQTAERHGLRCHRPRGSAP